jgi:hypothetical protein
MKHDQSSAPWWKYGHVWLVIAGPAVVVVAALFTAWLAVRNPDPVLAEEHYRRPAAVNKGAANDSALMPALQGRNHAATAPAH